MTSCRELLLIKTNKIPNLIIVHRAQHKIRCHEQFGINLTFDHHCVFFLNDQSSRSLKSQQRSNGVSSACLLCFKATFRTG